MKSGTFSRIWAHESRTGRVKSATPIDNARATRRAHYDLSSDTEIGSVNEPIPSPAQGTIVSNASTSETAADERPGRSGKGYWNVMSLFRSGNGSSAT